MSQILGFLSLLFVSNCSAYLPLPTTFANLPFLRLSNLVKPTQHEKDAVPVPAPARVPAAPTPKDLEDAFAEVMWRMKIFQEDPEFIDSQPTELQRLFQSCQESVCVSKSSIPEAGNGLFAAKDIPAGSIFTFYPVHAMGVHFRDGSSFLHCREDHDHTSSAYVMSLIGSRPILGTIDLEKNFDGGIGFVDADPKREIKNKAWQCHYINDGAIITNNTPEHTMKYYTASLKAQNAVFVPFGPAPTCVAVATKALPRNKKYTPVMDGPIGWDWSSQIENYGVIETMKLLPLKKRLPKLSTRLPPTWSPNYELEELQLYEAFHHGLA